MYKMQLIIAGIVLAALIALGIFFYRRGKKQVTLQYGPGELPGNPGSGAAIGASNDDIKKIANDLYADMKGFAWMGHDYEPYADALRLNDTDLIKLYNTFNTLYQNDTSDHDTLTRWIAKERYADTTLPDLLISKLKKLNCL